jgi:hypothetical protein
MAPGHGFRTVHVRGMFIGRIVNFRRRTRFRTRLNRPLLGSNAPPIRFETIIVGCEPALLNPLPNIYQSEQMIALYVAINHRLRERQARR